MWLGAHIGIADGLSEAPKTAHRIGCEAIQIFSKSPQMWKGTPIPDDAAAGFRAAVVENGLKTTAIHHGYLINLASPKKAMLARSRVAFVDELERAEKLGVAALIFHPGAHLGSGTAAGIQALIESLDWAVGKTPGFKVRALLENAAGQGTAMCATFPELSAVLNGVSDRRRFGVTLDTCHLFAAGFDFRTPELYAALMERIDRELGLSEVRAFHLNDAKADLGSHLDRHENIGQGQITVEGFRPFVNDPRWSDRPGFLETPLDEDGYGRYEVDLTKLRSLLGVAPAPVAGPGRRPRGTSAA
jgi:deoxyribonuclease IV